MHEHTAEITKATPDQEVVFCGEFHVTNGDLTFICHTRNIEFTEVLEGLTKLRDEITRQIDNQTKCPFHPKNLKNDRQ